MQDKDLMGNNNENIENPDNDNLLKDNEENMPDGSIEDSISDNEQSASEEEIIDEEYYETDSYDDNEDEPAKPVKRSKGSRVRRKKKKNKWMFILLRITLIICISIILSVFLISLGKEYLGVNKSDDVITVTISEGDTTYDIAEMLYKKGVIKSPKLFRVISKIKEADPLYKAGDHIVVPNMGYDVIIDQLTQDPLNESYETVSITFNEGVNLYQAAQMLYENDVINDTSRFLYYFNSKEFLDKDKYKFASYLSEPDDKKFYQMEGYFFPDTYTFYAGFDDSSDESMPYRLVCEKIYENFDKKIEPYLSKVSDTQYTLDELVTLASIVQAEAPSHDSMKMVSSVFYNRLKNPEAIGRTQPFLESDPTEKYANEVIKPNIEQTGSSQLIIQAYNTYEVAGLTPGAICNPGIEAIDAVFNAPQTDYYYFCANIYTKETYYAKTLDEHEQNLAMVQEQYDAMPETEVPEQ